MDMIKALLLIFLDSITSKLTSLASPDKITIGKDVYDILHPEIKGKFTEIRHSIEDWKYTDRRIGELYKLYTLQN